MVENLSPEGGPLMRPPFPDSLRMASLETDSACTASLRGGSLRKIVGSLLRGSATGASSDRDGGAATCVVALPFVSGDGNCALAMAAARESSLIPRRSSMRRSTRVPHIPQNFMPGSFTWSHPEHFALPDWRPSAPLAASPCALRMSRKTYIPDGFQSRKVQAREPLNSF